MQNKGIQANTHHVYAFNGDDNNTTVMMPILADHRHRFTSISSAMILFECLNMFKSNILDLK